MSSQKRKEKVINVDKLIVKANKVIFVDEQRKERDLWGFSIRRDLPVEENDVKLIGEVKEEHEDKSSKTENIDTNINIEENARRRQFDPWGFPIRRELPVKESDQKMTDEIQEENESKQ